MYLKNCFPVFKQVIISTDNFEFEMFSLEKGKVSTKKQTLSGLLELKTKFDLRMTGEKSSNSKNM